MGESTSPFTYRYCSYVSNPGGWAGAGLALLRVRNTSSLHLVALSCDLNLMASRWHLLSRQQDGGRDKEESKSPGSHHVTPLCYTQCYMYNLVVCPYADCKGRGETVFILGHPEVLPEFCDRLQTD